MLNYLFRTLFKVVDQLRPTLLELIDLSVEIFQFNRSAAVEMFAEKLQTVIQRDDRLSDIVHFRLRFLKRRRKRSPDPLVSRVTIAQVSAQCLDTSDCSNDTNIQSAIKYAKQIPLASDVSARRSKISPDDVSS